MINSELLTPILTFLHCPTPESWIKEAAKKTNLSIMLWDHLLCELKAGQAAMHLIRKYAVDDHSVSVLIEWFKPYEDLAYRKIGGLDTLKGKNTLSQPIIAKAGSSYNQMLVDKMVLLIKEELHHFYQVLEIIDTRGFEYENIGASRYAKGLLGHVRTYEPNTLIDKLIIGAYIEARSCERFAKIAPHLDDELAKFYTSLLRSEARHYQDYLSLAEQISEEDITERVHQLGLIEAELISSPDCEFKLHSGKPI